MANRTKIKELARQLDLINLSKRKYTNSESSLNGLDLLELVLGEEVTARKIRAISRSKKASNLPDLELSLGKFNSGIRYHIDKLLKFEWVGKSQNLLVQGECGMRKTALVSYLGNRAIEYGLKVFYLNLEELLILLNNIETTKRVKSTMSRVRNIDILVVDDFLYLDISKEELERVYKFLIMINDTTSIVFISNRIPHDWIDRAEDKYSMQLFVQRCIAPADTLTLSQTN